VIGRNYVPPLNRDKLYDLYITKHMRMIDVAKEFGVCTDTIRRDLNKYNIQIRKRGYGFLVHPEIKYSPEQLEFFDGLTVSDGNLAKPKQGRAFKNSFVSCKFKYEEFAEYINEYLDFKCKVKMYRHYSERYKKGYCDNYNLYSQNNIFFTKELSRWYPAGGEKIVPMDFRFSPISINIMYLGDGFITSGGAVLCTNSFTESNLNDTFVQWFAQIGIMCAVKTGNKLYFNMENTRKFLEYIGECPVKCYEYKWKVREIAHPTFIKPLQEDLFEMYIGEKMSSPEISKVYKTSANVISRYLRKYNIPVRSLSEAVKLAKNK